MKILCRSLLIISIILFFSIVKAEEKKLKTPPILIESSVDKANITIGDIVKYSLNITYDSSIKVVLPHLGANLGEFEIKDYKVSDPKQLDNGRVSSLSEYQITTFTTGDYVIPPVTVKYKVQGKDVQEIQSEKIFIRVNKTPSHAQDKEDIRGLKNVTELKISKIYYVLGVISLIFIIAVIIIYKYYLKKQAAGEQVINTAPLEPPYDRAIRELNELKNKDWLNAGKIKEFFIILSEILRRYIGGRYGILALDRTTEEIMAEFKLAKVKWDDVKIYKEIFEFSDMVKFAKLIPEKIESEKIFSLSEQIVNSTKPIEIEEINFK
ncbi:hypothetical protein HZA55_01200 [Candidatus Poribacteria bacterium]|nr:hypothetical protein [Candidatus Poribacteria bacterium]